MFITLEGGEGSGKSTLARTLTDWLEGEHGRNVYATRNPGGTVDTAEIRRLIVEGEPGRWDPLTEAMLLYSDRRHHWISEIKPALDAGSIVICDRFFDSTDVYQGAGRGVNAETLNRLRRLAIGDVAPELTLVLDVPVSVGLERAFGRGGSEVRFENFDESFHESLRQAYLSLTHRKPERCKLLDGSLSQDALFEAAKQIIEPQL